VDAVDLSGRWRACLADPERRRSFSAPDADDDGEWHDIDVPGHWRSVPAFADSDGPLLYRRRFDVDSASKGQRRWWLMLDGLFYLGDVWLDGRYLGDTEGYFFSHQFEVTDQIDPARPSEHLLAVEVACSPQTDRTHKRNLTGSLQHSTWLDPDWNPGGIWRPVRLESSGPLRIRHARLRCTHADEHRAELALRVVVDATAQSTARLRTTVSPTADPSDATEHELDHVVAAGENRIEWTVTVPRPRLWWPHALGEQHHYDVRVEVSGDDRSPDEAPSDIFEVRTGLREVRLDRWIMSVNGERLFLKGTNLGPTKQGLADATAEEVRADVQAAKDLGLDLVRVHSHISRTDLYQAADEAGMLVWQDLPLQWSYQRGVRRQALRQAREAVDLLAHHPSIAIWCAHSEPLAAGFDGTGLDPDIGRRERLRRQLGQMLPSWNKNRLDPSLRRTVRTTDGTRPVISASGLLPQLPLLDGTDSHLWFGWEYGTADDLAAVAARWPRLVRFVGEFGAQAVPSTAGFCEPERWPNLDWDRLASRHGLRRDLLDPIARPDDFGSFDEWRAATQAYQARLLRRQIETLRSLKYRPTGGFAQFFLADGHPAISHSLFDHRRQPKLAVEEVRASCAAVIVTARVAPGSGTGSLPVDIHVISDRRSPVAGVTVTAAIDGEPVRRWHDDLAADTCSYVGTVHLTLDERPEACRALELRIDTAAGPLAENRYLVDPAGPTLH
jgi:beta-mannosidase